MQVRPKHLQIDRFHPLAKGLVFAGLGAHPGGGTMFDSSLRKNNGTLTNIPASDWQFSAELGRWTCYVNGTTEYIDIPYTGRLSQWSLSCWVRVDAGETGDQGLMGTDLPNNDGWWIDVVTSSYRLATMCEGQVRYSDTLTPISEWTEHWRHLAVTSDGTTQVFYIDGVANGTVAAYQMGVDEIGNWVYVPRPLHGRIADPLIHARALSPTEIADLADPSNVYLAGLIPGRRRPVYFMPTETPTTVDFPFRRYYMGVA